jgi:hypothetical protein
VLDSAWDQLSTKPLSTSADAITKEKEIDTYPSSPEYDPIPQLDLQTPSLMMEEFVNQNNDYEESVVDLKASMLEKVLQSMNGDVNESTSGIVLASEWILNDNIHDAQEQGAF